VWEQAPPPRIRLIPARHHPAQWLLHVHEDVSQHARTIVFVVVGRPVRLPGLHPVLPPQPTAPPTVAAVSRSMLVNTGTGRVGLAPGLSSVRAAEEDMVVLVLAMLRLS
jgi:hypothetical protein